MSAEAATLPVRVALIDDQELVRSGIRSLLALSSEVTVVAEGGDGSDATRIAREHSPEVFLMDIRMPRMNGIEAIKAMQSEGIMTPVIILTTFDDHDLLIAGIQAGARGYLLKDVSLENLIEAIKSVQSGETMVQPAITESLLKGISRRDDAMTGFDSQQEPEALSEREVEVLRLIASGCSNREISQALSKSEGTVKNQVSNILAKLGVRDRTRAVLRAIEIGLL
ncbi:MAG: response regulator transcription factor [Pseudomonadota bacterium]